MKSETVQGEAGKRTYDSPLRRENAERTRKRILDAAASVISEDGTFVVAQVAELAGVSVRTVYHHFPDRETMLDALGEWLAAQLGYPRQDLPEDFASFADATVEMTKQYSADFERARAFFSTPVGQAARQHSRARRLKHLRGLAEVEFAGVDPQTAGWAAVIIHVIASSRTWLAMRDEAGFDGSEAAEAVGWAIRTLVESVKTEASDEAQKSREES
ncbi:MAG TPA: TetR/AcrR family transcriptional regulator [Acidimicrobiia bacterium]|nr:TetR/AcrR family transcriptional regulator [Acidimicrobiia bacterium]